MSLIGANGQLFGWSEQAWLILDQLGILLGNLMFGVSVVGAAWAWFSRDKLRRWFQANRFPDPREITEEEQCWQALLFTVSRAEVPEWLIRRQQPQAVALLATEKSMQVANDLAALCHENNIQVFGPHRLDDPDDAEEAKTASLQLLNKLRARGYARTAVDVTGGKTPMSLGAFMAAVEAQADAIYVATEFDAELKQPNMRTARVIRIQEGTHS